MSFKRFYHRLRNKIRENWKSLLIGSFLFYFLKIPFRFLFVKLNFILGYSFFCGVYALLFLIIRNNLKNRQVTYNKYNYLAVFLGAMFFSYLAVNYNILQLISLIKVYF